MECCGVLFSNKVGGHIQGYKSPQIICTNFIAIEKARTAEREMFGWRGRELKVWEGMHEISPREMENKRCVWREGRGRPVKH